MLPDIMTKKINTTSLQVTNCDHQSLEIPFPCPALNYRIKKKSLQQCPALLTPRQSSVYLQHTTWECTENLDSLRAVVGVAVALAPVEWHEGNARAIPSKSRLIAVVAPRFTHIYTLARSPYYYYIPPTREGEKKWGTREEREMKEAIVRPWLTPAPVGRLRCLFLPPIVRDLPGPFFSSSDCGEREMIFLHSPRSDRISLMPKVRRKRWDEEGWVGGYKWDMDALRYSKLIGQNSAGNIDGNDAGIHVYTIHYTLW